MGEKIKTAWEKAMERFEEKTKGVSEQDIMRMECLPEGQKLVGQFLSEPELNLLTALEQYDQARQELILNAVEDTLINRLVLPEDEQALKDNRRVMEGLQQLKKDKELLSSLMGELEHMFNFYLQSRNHASESLEQEFRSHIENTMRERGMDPGQAGQVDPARHPRFQEEWTKLMGQINEKFLPAFEEMRQKLKKLS